MQGEVLKVEHDTVTRAFNRPAGSPGYELGGTSLRNEARGTATTPITLVITQLLNKAKEAVRLYETLFQDRLHLRWPSEVPSMPVVTAFGPKAQPFI